MDKKLTRHIPEIDICEIDNISFDDALQKSLTQNADYDADQWLYVPNSYTEYRYILGTKGNNPIICIGINPSTAKPGALDPTLKSVERIAFSNGFDSFLMLNVIAQRATLPENIDKKMNKTLHKENLKSFEFVLNLIPFPYIWAAWGTIILNRPYLMECLSDIAALAKQYNAKWLCAGNCSKAGHPHHPLYLKKDEQFKPFDIDNYLKRTF